MPRTRNESLQHILDELEAGRLGAMDPGSKTQCVYEDDKGNHCAIGCLLTTEQHKVIKSNNANGFSVAGIFQVDGGMLSIDEIAPDFTINELKQIQKAHDDWAGFSGLSNGYETTETSQKESFVYKIKSMMF